jgi:hypothetical protein
MPKSTISRYLSGKRTPDARGNAPKQLAEALVKLGERNGVEGLYPEEIEGALELAAGGSVNYQAFPERLGYIMDAFDVANNRLAHYLNFDPSYISRILSGQRMPADMPHFIDGVAAYIARNGSSMTDEVASMLGFAPELRIDARALSDGVRSYLYGGSVNMETKTDRVSVLLTELDTFDLNDYLRATQIDASLIEQTKGQTPVTKVYEGLKEMKQAELDFLQTAVQEDSTEDVVLYSDMPMTSMMHDKEFPKKVMAGVALLLRKGVRLQNIHNVHRPLNEMIMGIEGWLPAYLTGQMDSYYLPVPTNEVFLHFIRTAGTVAVSGEAIAGSQASGRYVVTRDPDQVAYLRRRSRELLAHALPLLRVWRAEEKDELDLVLEDLAKKADVEPVEVGSETFKNLTITLWPESHALIEKSGAPAIYLLVEHPALVSALERYEPTLF